MTRHPRIPASARPSLFQAASLFQAGAALRFAVALGLALPLWGAILWACR